MRPQAQSEGFELREYLVVLLKRKWTFLAFFLVVMTLVLVGTFAQTPVYRATCTVLIERQAPKVVSFSEVVALGANNYYDTKSYYETQFKIIKSRSAAREVIKRMGLEKELPFSKVADPVEALLNRVSVDPVKKSHLVSVSVDHADPRRGAEIANMVAAVYRDMNLNAKLSASSDALQWLDKEGGTLADKVKESEVALQRFKEEKNVVSFEERQNIISQRLSELSSALTQAKRSRIDAESLYRKTADYAKSPQKVQTIPSVLENKLIQELKAEKIALDKQLSELSKKYKGKHPEIVKVTSQLELMERTIAQEIAKIVQGIETQYLVARDRETALSAEMEKLKKEKQELDNKEIEYKVLLREAQSNQSLFEAIQKRTKETQVTENLRTNNVRIIDPAEVSTKPVRPRVRMNIVLGFLLGLFGGIGLAFFFEYLDNTIKTQQDVKEFLQLPFLGVIPSLKDLGGGPEDIDLFAHKHPKSSVTESCRAIRTSITFSAPGQRLRKLLVTSAGPQEGKSTTVINLGIIFAQVEKRVLIIDSDLRKPRIHKAFGIPKERPGLTNLVMGEAETDDVIVASKVPNLDLITCGPIPPNPSELLGSSRMESVIQSLEERYDWILFDSPPIVAVTDAVVLSRIVDGVILVIKSAKSTRDIVLKARHQLQDVGANILGAVLNDFNIKEQGYKYYYYHHYYRDEDRESGNEPRKSTLDDKRAT